MNWLDILAFERRGCSLEDAEIGADGNEGGAHIEIAAGIGFDRSKYPGCFALRFRLFEHRLDGRLHFRVGGIAQMAESGSKIGRADKKRVHSVNGGNLCGGGNPGLVFDLDSNRDVVVDDIEIIRNRAIDIAALSNGYRTPCGGYRVAATAALASSTLWTNGMRKLKTPASSSRLMSTVSFHCGRTTGADEEDFSAISCGIRDRMSLGACSRSISNQSKPARPRTSVEIGLPSALQQPISVLPARRS